MCISKSCCLPLIVCSDPWPFFEPQWKWTFASKHLVLIFWYSSHYKFVPGQAGTLSFQDMVHWSQLLTHHQEWTEGSDHCSPNAHWMADHSWKKSVCMPLRYWACLWCLLGTESYHCNGLDKILARFQDLSQGNSMMMPSLNVLSIDCHLTIYIIGDVKNTPDPLSRLYAEVVEHRPKHVF